MGFVVKCAIIASGLLLFLDLLIIPLSASYAPRFVECPADFKIRQTGNQSSGAQSLGREEDRYRAERRAKILPNAYRSYLENVNSYTKTLNNSQIILPSYVEKIFSSENQTVLPRVSLAVAGGAYRGAIFGASLMNVFDGRNQSSVAAGTGGLLQTIDYITGLSGSAWLLCSWLASELAPLYDLVLGKQKKSNSKIDKRFGWMAEYGLLNPTEDLSIVKQRSEKFWLVTKYWAKIIEQVLEKRLAGFPISVVDSWGRILSHHFLSMLQQEPEDFFEWSFNQGLNQTFSDFANLPSFKNFTQPFPILTTLPLSKTVPGSFPAPLDTTQYEFSPYEFGSYDPFISSFVPTSFLGTEMYAGTPVDPNACTKGFDNAGFMMAMSSNLFPAYEGLLSFYFNVTLPFQGYIPKGVTAITPNPFQGLGSPKYTERNDYQLELVDGGFGNEVTPYAPLLVGARKVETIIAIDGTGDHENYANGSSLIATAKRVAFYSDSYKFPIVPLNVSTFISERLAERPTFFGCNESGEVPLIVWIANSYPLDGSKGVTNTSTLQSAYPIHQTRQMMNEAIKTGIRGFPSSEMLLEKNFKDPLWPICLSCAVADRARERLGAKRSGICISCFERYCWSP